jgi:hypothetical protein
MIPVALQKEYKLTKLPHSKLKVIEAVMSYYLLSFSHEDYTDEILEKLSVLVHIWDKKLKSKINKRFPSETTSLKFMYHEAKLMIEVFVKFKLETYNIEEHKLNNAIVENLKTTLHRQVV